MAEEDYKEPPPPSQEKVAKRALILSAIACRGMIDADPDAADLSARIWLWLQDLGLAEELSEWEHSLLNSPFGSLSLKNRMSAGWLSEGQVVMAWALGKTELPVFDMQCDAQRAAKSLGFLQSKNETILANPTLLPAQQLTEYNEFVYNLHWRIRDFAFRQASYDFESLARKAWGEPILRHGLQIIERI